MLPAVSPALSGQTTEKISVPWIVLITWRQRARTPPTRGQLLAHGGCLRAVDLLQQRSLLGTSGWVGDGIGPSQALIRGSMRGSSASLLT
jgi:hypothetical protein